MNMKHVLIGGGLAAAAIIGIHYAAGKVYAADLGGNCCADLEERIAELEATTAKKGNRKVRLTISGEISKALLIVDGLDPLITNKPRIIDNGNSGTKVRLKGEATLTPGITAGMVFEYGFDETKGTAITGVGPVLHWLDGEAQLRKSAVWVKTALGKFTVGRDSIATDNITEIDLSETGLASRMLSFEPLWTYVGLGGLPIVGGNLLNPAPFHDLRAEVLRWDSPTIAGFEVSASWGGGQTASGDDMFDVALRYAGEAGGFRFAAGGGYRVEKYTTLGALDQKTVSGSASLLHSISGIFVSVSAADQKDNPLYGHIQMMHGKAGLKKNWFGVGDTAVFGEYAEHKLKDMDINSSFYGAGIQQSFDAAALDVFLSVRQYKSDVLSGDATTVLSGVRLKF